MLVGSEEKFMAQTKAPQSFNAETIHTILGPESSFEGKLVFNGGRVRVDGNFKGEIKTSSTLIVGESARVEANLDVGSIIVTGDVIGDITAKNSVSVERPGKIKGTIVTPELMIEKGVIFEGSCRMEQASLDSGTTPSVTLLNPTDPSI